MPPSRTGGETTGGDDVNNTQPSSTQLEDLLVDIRSTNLQTVLSMENNPQLEDRIRSRPFTESLSNANSALEDVYALLRQVRSTLRHLDEQGLILSRGALSARPTTSTRDEIAPNHSAIVLADPQRSRDELTASLNSRLDALLNTLPPSSRQLMETNRQNIGEQGSSPVRAEQYSLDGQPTPALNALISRPTEGLTRTSSVRSNRISTGQTRPPASQSPWAFRSRINNPDDASTSLGRRVAARTAPNMPTTASASSQRTVSAASAMARDWDAVIAARRINRLREAAAARSSRPSFPVMRGGSQVASVPASLSRQDSTSSDSDEDTIGSQLLRSALALDASARRLDGDRRSHPIWVPPRLRGEISRGDSNPRSIGATTTAAARNAAQSISSLQDTSADSNDERRGYTVRRHLNEDGEEVVHHINMDGWWDPPAADTWSWARPSPFPNSGTNNQSSDTESPRPASRPLGATTDDIRSASEHYWDVQLRSIRALSSNVSNTALDDRLREPLVTLTSRYDPPSMSDQFLGLRRNTTDRMGAGGQRRRRGWARLNADGEEIPTDVEEEIERDLSAMRARRDASSRSNRDASTQLRREYLIPLVRDTHSLGIIDDENSNRGGLFRGGSSLENAEQIWHFGPSHVKHEEDDPEEDPRLWDYDGEEFYLNPLPLPLEEDIPGTSTSKNASQSKPRRMVSRMSQLAAR